jgi:hypothetical protein
MQTDHHSRFPLRSPSALPEFHGSSHIDEGMSNRDQHPLFGSVWQPLSLRADGVRVETHPLWGLLIDAP